MSGLELKEMILSRPGFRLRIPEARVASGEWLALSAPSGFGKTTFFRALLGLDSGAGEIRLNDRRIDLLPVHQRNIGMVFQEPLLLPHLTARENVLLGLRLRGRQDRDATKLRRLEEAFEVLGLASRRDARPSELSGGERQRVAWLRALLPGPELLLLDEPFKGLDSDMIHRVREFAEGFLSERPVPVLWNTHLNEFEPKRWKRWVGRGMHHADRYFEYDSQ